MQNGLRTTIRLVVPPTSPVGKTRTKLLLPVARLHDSTSSQSCRPKLKTTSKTTHALSSYKSIGQRLTTPLKLQLLCAPTTNPARFTAPSALLPKTILI